jgi:hypothetical protein
MQSGGFLVFTSSLYIQHSSQAVLLPRSGVGNFLLGDLES